MSASFPFPRPKSKAELRAELAALGWQSGSHGSANAPMASAEDLKRNSNVPSLNFRGTASWSRVPAGVRCNRND